jgi:hypothetical protein
MEADKSDLEAQLKASLNRSCNGQPAAEATPKPNRARRRGVPAIRSGQVDKPLKPDAIPGPPEAATPDVQARVSQMTLRHKLGEVRRRIGYIQKRGYNERHNYNYVAAADIAGTIGDLLAELGVIVIPRLESIAYEPHAPGRGERVARVIMAYTFTDEDSAEELTARVAGEGLDVGDKAAYKAMTGALKYALLQSFLLATGDDPEDERAERAGGLDADHPISAEQAEELRELIEKTGTDPQRVLAYYKISALSEMSEICFKRALELLRRKLEKQSQGDTAHAPH